ncbi:recombinase family protein, partial [Clostridium botulinum]|nr:recombinase family protein [Clostridium botulinum]
EIFDSYSEAIIYEEEFKNNNRNKFFKLINKLKENDLLVITKINKLFVNLNEAIKYIDMFINKGVKIHILNIGLIDDKCTINLLLDSLLGLQKFNNNNEKKVCLKEHKEGRPKKFTDKKLNYALNLLSVNGGNKSYNQVAKETKISKSTLIRAMKTKKNKTKIHN